ncbi:short-chain dehydrogenase [bacterium]|nr:MAG: short-chain dehydrogenase [bacterium]
MTAERVLVAGATSAIAAAVARRYAEAGADLVLAARDAGKLSAVADDLRVRGTGRVETFVIDMVDTARQAELLAAAQAALGRIDVVLVAWGTLPDQAAIEHDVAATLACWEANATSVVAFLAQAADVLEAQRGGCLAVITSVAGVRGRRANYTYGAAKAGVIAFAQGLRARLFAAGVAVVELRPGPVDTPMTARLRKGPLFIGPERAGALIVGAIRRRRDIAYIPGYWRWIMLAVALVPEGVMKRLNLSAG